MLTGNAMKKLVLIFFLVSLVLFVHIGVFAQQNPTLDQVLDNYVKALGGKEALQKITSRILKGTYKIGSTGVNMPLEIYAKARNNIMLKVNVSKSETIQRGFNGSDGWAKDLNLDEIRSITGTELLLLKTKADFYWAINLKTLYPQLAFKEKKTIDFQLPNNPKPEKKEVYILETKAESLPKEEKRPIERFYFDSKTGLLLRSDIDTEVLVAGKKEVTKNGVTFTEHVVEVQIVPIEIYYENYKEIDGVKIPMTTRQAISSNNIIIEFTTVEHNKPIDDKLFSKPVK